MEPTRAGSVPTRGRMSGLAALVAIAAVVGACAAPGASSAPPATNPPATSGPATGVTLQVRQDAALGSFVADAEGMSLYLFTMDKDGKSACGADCVGSWPPLTVANAADARAGSGVTGAVGTITRDDGSLQVTLAGAPLYYFAADSAAGDTKGQEVGGVWFLISPAGSKIGGAGTPTSGQPDATECDSPACY